MSSRLTVALLLLALCAGCGSTRVVRLDTGEGSPRVHTPPSAGTSVEVGADDFAEAMARLVLEEPLAVRSAQRGGWVRASSSNGSMDNRWERLLLKSFRGRCQPHQPRGDCLSFLDDVLGMSSRDKLAVAVGLSIDPMRQSIAEAVENTLTPQLFYAAILSGLVSWVALAAAPEPVFTKAAAIVSAIMLIYLGVDAFLEVVKASFELKRATDSATTFEELQEASQRYGHAVGPPIARVFVLGVTVLVGHGAAGGTSWLAARMPLLPRFSEAAALGGSQVGLNLAAVGEVSAVAVVEGNLVISLAPTALAMAAPDANALGGAQVTPGVYKTWGSSRGFRKAMGPAGKDKEWHHIVEQTPGNVKRFGPMRFTTP